MALSVAHDAEYAQREKRMMENIPPDEQPILSGNSPEREPQEEPPKMQTFFGNYASRLQALTMLHNLEPAVLKGLVEDAFGKCDTPPAEQEAKDFSLFGKIQNLLSECLPNLG